MANAFKPDDFNPHDPAFLANPYPVYDNFRTQAPIHPVTTYGSDWMFRYEDCAQVLTDTAVWIKNPPQGSERNPGPYGMVSNFPQGLFASDPPLHTTLRGILEPLLTQAITSAPALAGQFATPLLAAAKQRGRIELVNDYALPLPSSVLFTLLGIPNDPGVWTGLVTYQAAIVAAHDITQSLPVRGVGATCSMAVNTFFAGMRVGFDGQPGQGLFAQMCAAFEQTGLTPEQVQMCAIDFLVAGYLSTTFIVGTGIRNLLENPTQLTALRRNPKLISAAVEEMLRFDGPVQVIDRYAASDTVVAGRKYRTGAKVTAVVGSGDHDPAAFANPEAFLIRRFAKASRSHLAFGDGIHYCVGAPLARLVAPVAITMLLDAAPNLARAGTPQWQTDPYLRAVTSLPVSVA